MSWVHRLLTVLVCLVVPGAVVLLLTAVTVGPLWWLVVVVGLAMLVYGIVAAVLGSYDLGTGAGWLALLVDVTWSLPNTVFGARTA